MKKKIADNLFYGLLLLPAVILFVLFFIIPVIQSAWLSFTDSYGMRSSYHFIGFANYKEALADLSFKKTIGATSKYALISVVVGNVLSLILALILDSRLRFKNFLRAVFFIPNIVSLLVVGYIWTFIYTSVFPDIFTALGMKGFAILGNKKTVIPALAAAGIWNAAGYYMVIYIAALQGIPEEMIEAARIDGTGFFKMLRYILLPLISPTIFTCLILSIAAHMKVFELPYTMTSGGPVGESTTMVYKIYTTAFNANRNGYASAQSMLLFLIIASLTLAMNFLIKKKEDKL